MFQVQVEEEGLVAHGSHDLLCPTFASRFGTLTWAKSTLYIPSWVSLSCA